MYIYIYYILCIYIYIICIRYIYIMYIYYILCIYIYYILCIYIYIYYILCIYIIYYVYIYYILCIYILYFVYIYIYIYIMYIYILCRESWNLSSTVFQLCKKQQPWICRPAALKPPMRSMRCKSGLPDTDPIFWWLVPSGELTVCYWKWPFIVDFPIKNGDLNGVHHQGSLVMSPFFTSPNH